MMPTYHAKSGQSPPRSTAGGRWLLALCLLALPALSGATDRDPTEPPPAARRADSPALAGAAAADPVIRHLVMVDGRRYVFDGARRFGVGDRLGPVRIACIHDDGVTVRDDDGALRHLSLHGTVRIRPDGAKAPAPTPCPEASASKRTPR